MKKPRPRNSIAFSAIVLVTALGLIGCSSPSPLTTDGASDDPSVTATDDTTPGGDALGCPAAMDALMNVESDDVERVSPADYFLPGLDDEVLANACIYENEAQGKSAQWAWFRGEDIAAVETAITEALAAAGYTVDSEFEGAQLYISASNPSLTLITYATAEEAAAKDGEQLFGLLGPWVQVLQYYS